MNGEYIIHLGDYREEDIPTLVPRSKLVTVYSIGSEKFALIKLERKSPASGDIISVYNTAVANVTIHPNRIFHVLSGDEENGIEPDERDSRSCGVQETGGKYWGLTRISSRNRPDYNKRDSYVYNDTGLNVTVFVMDSGVNVNHTTFGGRAAVGYTAPDILEREGADDLTGHGTAVASIIAGTYTILSRRECFF